MTPMQFQYLVGLCCAHNHPDSVDITIGDMVMDIASEKERDVDVTVTINESKDSIRAFKGFEVKKETSPLDVGKVEQLCIKLKDMPKIGYKAIVSASGFSKGSLKKAKHHGVDLFQLKLVTDSFEKYFPALGSIGVRKKYFENFGSRLLCWKDWSIKFDVSQNVKLIDETVLFSEIGKPHKQFSNIKTLIQKSLQESTDKLFRTSDFQQLNEPKPYQYTLYFSSELVFVKDDGQLIQVNSITISGQLYWEQWALSPELYVLENIFTGAVFAGAVIAPYRPDDDRMVALILRSDSNSIGINHIVLTDKQKNMIYKLKLRQN